MKQIAVFDMDGVLADFTNAYTALAAARYGLGWDFIRCQGQMTSWGSTRTTAAQDDELWEEIKSSPTFWAGMNPLITPGEIRDMALLTHNKVDVVYLTSRVGLKPAEQTAKWVKWHDLPRGQVTICPAHLKVKAIQGLPGKVLGFVDDKTETVNECWDAGLPVFCRDWMYNRDANKDIPRVSSVGEFIHEVLKKCS